MKYDRMIAIKKEQSNQKERIAMNEIQRMLDRRERISVTTLVRTTGFSRGFFYGNEKVRQALDQAVCEQGSAYNPKQVIINNAMEQKIIDLKISITKMKVQLKELEDQNKKLKEENELLKRQLSNRKA